jgi:RNA polymerase sigma-70 factor (ECF subfamily)
MHVLSERQGLVIRMLFDEDLSVAETAARLGVDEQTVRSTKHKALTRLREHMADEFPADAGDARSADLVQREGREHP